MSIEKLEWLWRTKLGALIAGLVFGTSTVSFFFIHQLSTYKDQISFFQKERDIVISESKEAKSLLNAKLDKEVNKITSYYKAQLDMIQIENNTFRSRINSLSENFENVIKKYGALKSKNDKQSYFEQLIKDPYLNIACNMNQAGCDVEFSDPGFVQGGRNAIYYVRAIQEPTPAINAMSLRCDYNDENECEKSNPCYGDNRTPPEDACLGDNEERAWSSPIYVGYDPKAAAASAVAEADLAGH